MNWILLATLFFSSKLVIAENGQILRCYTSSERWNSLFQIDAVGASYLKFQKVGSEQIYTCGLAIEHIGDNQKAVSPHFRLSMSRGECVPELNSELSREILNDLKLIVTIDPNKNTKGRLQWLIKEQPEICHIDKINLGDLEFKAKKWIEGKWGRSTASNPKDAPQGLPKKSAKKK